jgi:hypothetical protein
MWSDAFLIQAQSDWQIYEHLEKMSFSRCHALHYLQMTTEKLAKAYLLHGRTGIKDVRSTHRALTRYLLDLSRNKRLQGMMGMAAKQLRPHIQKLLPLAYEIEKLAPALAGDGPNPEYPWEAPIGIFNVPATYEFTIRKALHQPPGHNLIKLIRLALKNFAGLRTA